MGYKNRNELKTKWKGDEGKEKETEENRYADLFDAWLHKAQ